MTGRNLFMLISVHAQARPGVPSLYMEYRYFSHNMPHVQVSCGNISKADTARIAFLDDERATLFENVSSKKKRTAKVLIRLRIQAV